MARFFRFLSFVNSTSTPTLPQPAEPPEAVSTESDIVVILAALLCAIICAVGLIAVARCAWLRRGTAALNSQLQSQSLANKGLKKKTLQSLPKSTYDVDSKSKFETECAICLVEFVDGDEIRVLPQCSHGFHVGCIDTWLGSHSSCPSCRQILVIPRCRKCGEYPAISGDTTETEAKSRVEVGGSSEFLP